MYQLVDKGYLNISMGTVSYRQQGSDISRTMINNTRHTMNVNKGIARLSRLRGK